MRFRISIVTAAALLSAVSATAQVLELPPRPYRGLFGGGAPPDPNRTHQELALSGNLLGGYDDNLTPPAGQLYETHPSGYTGFSDAALRYTLGRAARGIEVRGRGYMNTYRNFGITPSYGGEERVRAITPFGRRLTVEANESLEYAPYFSLGLFAPLQATSALDPPDRNPTNGLRETGSWNGRANVRATEQWTRTTHMTVGYAFNTSRYMDKAAFDTTTNEGSLAFDQSIGRRVGLVATYRHSNSRYEEFTGAETPMVTDTGDLGLRYNRRLSRTRQLSLSGGGGAVRTDTVNTTTRLPFEFTAPSGYGTVAVDLGRSWNISADYRRSVTPLQGVSPQPFVTDAAVVSVGGFASRWLETVGSAGWSNGATGQTVNNDLGRFDGYTGAVQFRFKLSRFWSALASASHYEYRLNTVATNLLRVPAETHRTSVRIGVAWSLPLAGSYLAPPPAVEKK